MTADLQPDVDDVLQAEDPAGAEPTVKVSQQGPVRIQSLPRKAGATFSKTVGTTPTRLLGADHRRALVQISAADNAWIAYSKAGVQSAIDVPAQNGAYKLYGATTPNLPISAAAEIWIAAVTGTTVVSVLTELWATGDGPA